MYPLRFLPVYQPKIWGGSALQEKYGRILPSGFIGESWEISAHPSGLGVVANGPLAGLSIPELIRKYGVKFLGNRLRADFLKKFPLLVKLLDVRDKISVQVHPSDIDALHNEGESGKYEIWYILTAEPDAKIIYGLKPGTTPDIFKAAIEEGNVEAYLNEIPVKAGEVYIIPPGLVHTLQAGILVFEIEQNSETVYRIYDFNRNDLNGKRRELHISKALDVIRFDDFLPKYPIKPATDSRLIDSEFFKVDYCLHQDTKEFYNDGSRFYILTNLKGEAGIEYDDATMKWVEGESLLIPASLECFSMVGEVTYLKTYISY
jgi:mannose-6-phosphate isomerase